MSPAATALRAACRTRPPHQVARAFGVSLAVVYEALALNAPLLPARPAAVPSAALGTPRRRPPARPHRPPPPGPEPAHAALIARFRAGAPTWTVSRVAEAIGLPPAPVRSWLMGHGRLPAAVAAQLDALLPA